MRRADVCIVGAGLAGLSIAAAVEGGDIGVTVLERKPIIEPLGAGIILQPNAVRALQELDCFDEVLDAGAELTRLVHHRNGERLEIELHEVWPRLRLPTIAVHRHVLHEVLMRRASSKVDLHLSCDVAGVDAGASSRCVLSMSDGEQRSFDLVVAADGAQSSIRTLLVPHARLRPLGLWWARWLVDARSNIDREWQTERIAGAVVGTFPLGRDELQLFATIPGGQMSDDRREETLAALQRQSAVLRHGGEHGMRLVHVGPAWEVHPHVWHQGGVAFAGDAAHAMSPTLSAGGGLAIEDGVVLGRLLSSWHSVDAILENYERLRRRRLSWMAKVGRVQASTAQGTPGEASSADITQQVRSMYGLLDDPDYLVGAVRGGAGA